jgi:hypothetical protein
MSYQAPPPPFGGSASPPQPAPIPQPLQPIPVAPGAPPAKVAKRGLRTLGLLLGLLGLIGGLTLFVLSLGQQARNVENFARAPFSCRTTLEFENTGTFTMYLETKGTVGDIGGDCDANDESYDSGDNEPDAEVTLFNVDDNDEEVDLDRASEPSYDTGDFIGTAIHTVEIDEPGTYRLVVETEDDDFAIAVGQDPDANVSTLRLGGIGAALGGLLLGGLLWFLGRAKAPPAAPAAAVYQPALVANEPPYGGPGQWQPGGPPTMPMPGQPGPAAPTMPQPVQQPWQPPAPQ